MQEGDVKNDDMKIRVMANEYYRREHSENKTTIKIEGDWFEKKKQEPKCWKVDQTLLDECDEVWVEDKNFMGTYGVYTPICWLVLRTNLECKAMPFSQYPECVRAVIILS